MSEDEYLEAYSRGFRDGYAEGGKVKNVQYPMKSPNQFIQNEYNTKHCSICNITHRYEYSCWKKDCPYKPQTIKII